MSKLGEQALGIAGGAIAGAMGQGMGMLFGKANDERQLEQQRKLTEQQVEAQKDLNKSQVENQMDLWNRTNYKAQMKHLKDAGLNAGLIYGMSGGGGATAGASTGGSASGGTADGGVGRTGMGLQIASQLALINAQKENIEADTANKKADAEKKSGVDTMKSSEETRAIKFDTDLKERLKNTNINIRGHEEVIKGVEADKLNTEWNTMKEAGFNGKEVDPKSLAYKAIQAGFKEKMEQLKQAKLENRIDEAEAVIREFGANMAKNGIAPNSPWYVKMITELADSVGINLKDSIGGN